MDSGQSMALIVHSKYKYGVIYSRPFPVAARIEWEFSLLLVPTVVYVSEFLSPKASSAWGSHWKMQNYFPLMIKAWLALQNYRVQLIGTFDSGELQFLMEHLQLDVSLLSPKDFGTAKSATGCEGKAGRFIVSSHRKSALTWLRPMSLNETVESLTFMEK